MYALIINNRGRIFVRAFIYKSKFINYEQESLFAILQYFDKSFLCLISNKYFK